MVSIIFVTRSSMYLYDTETGKTLRYFQDPTGKHYFKEVSPPVGSISADSERSIIEKIRYRRGGI